MAIVSLDDAIMVCKADGDDNELLQRYLDGAIAFAESYCNRKFFEDEVSLAAAQIGLNAKIREAYDTYYSAFEDAEDAEADGTQAALSTGYRARAAAKNALNNTLVKITSVQQGIVVNPAIQNAVLMLTAKLYAERVDWVELPQGARDMLSRYVWIGGPMS